MRERNKTQEFPLPKRATNAMKSYFKNQPRTPAIASSVFYHPLFYTPSPFKQNTNPTNHDREAPAPVRPSRHPQSCGSSNWPRQRFALGGKGRGVGRRAKEKKAEFLVCNTCRVAGIYMAVGQGTLKNLWVKGKIDQNLWSPKVSFLTHGHIE